MGVKLTQRCLVKNTNKIFRIKSFKNRFGDGVNTRIHYELSNNIVYRESDIIIGDNNIRDYIIKNLN